MKILFRPDATTRDELEVARQYCSVVTQRSGVGAGETIIGRFSVLPFYRELEADVRHEGSSLINSWHQHNWVADLSGWYPSLEGLTPETWFRLDDVPEHTPVIVKGRTNSCKFRWDTHMFAADKKAAGDVSWRLLEDAVVGSQDLVYRRFVPLKSYLTSFRGLPVSEEYRFFCLDGKVLAAGFYWSDHIETIQEMGHTPDPSAVPAEFMREVLDRIGNQIRFVVVDVARTASGEWIVVELNDGQMSGLSCVDPHTLYQALSAVP